MSQGFYESLYLFYLVGPATEDPSVENSTRKRQQTIQDYFER